MGYIGKKLPDSIFHECSHPEVERVWQMGGLSADKNDIARLFTNILFKRGFSYVAEETNLTDEHFFDEAEKYLSELNNP